MTFKTSRLIGAVCCATVACLIFTQQSSAQVIRYHYPTNNYGWNYASQPSTQFYSAPRTTSYRSAPRTTSYHSTARPATGYGSNIHRNFTIRQEQLRSQRIGQPVRNRGNVRWVR